MFINGLTIVLNVMSRVYKCREDGKMKEKTKEYLVSYLSAFLSASFPCSKYCFYMELVMTIFLKHLLYVLYCYVCFAYINSFELHNGLTII